MWIWIIVFVLFIVLLIVIKEAGYYLFNQYLYGSKYEKQLKWKKRMMTLFTLFKKKLQIDIHQTKRARVHKEIM
ncbi:hypothetical protein QF028_000015 [Neobacillus sp. B4I6]|uniref:hypothetical protein n=1 Tax=Neobacillus sp. B4I6 TaxID=3373925 RepID=UPI003D242A0A